jgi:hypothetical protein
VAPCLSWASWAVARWGRQPSTLGPSGPRSRPCAPMPGWVVHVSAPSAAVFVRYALFTGTGMPAIFSMTEPSVDRVVK